MPAASRVQSCCCHLRAVMPVLLPPVRKSCQCHTGCSRAGATQCADSCWRHSARRVYRVYRDLQNHASAIHAQIQMPVLSMHGSICQCLAARRSCAQIQTCARCCFS
eukprot:scaffold191462_cov28-Tisochrysis_lutea.AAC.1